MITKNVTAVLALLLVTAWLVSPGTIAEAIADAKADEDYMGRGELTRHVIDVAGQRRVYQLYLPPGFAGPAPTVFALHGGGGTIEMLRASGFEQNADRSGYALVYPLAVNKIWPTGEGQSAGHDDDPAGTAPRLSTEEVEELAYFDTLFDSLIAQGIADRERIFVTGGSRGGAMTLRLGCERAGRIRAIAPSRFSMLQSWVKTCQPSRPLSVILASGTDDPFIPYYRKSGEGEGAAADRLVSVEETVQFWVQHNGCVGKPRGGPFYDLDPNDGTRAYEQRWEHCKDGTRVVSIRIEGMGHMAPGVSIPVELTRDLEKQFGKPYAEMMGRPSYDIHQPSEDWRFFERIAGHPL